MNTNEVTKRLKQEASNNDMARAVFLLWAMRHRARATVTLHSLRNAMVKQGFHFSGEKYEAFLKMMSDLNLGQLHVNSKGRPKSLVTVTYRLQSIGRVALGQDTKLSSMKRVNRFKELPKPTAPPRRQRKLILTLMLGERPLNIQVPPDLTSEELMTLIQGLQERRNGEVTV